MTGRPGWLAIAAKIPGLCKIKISLLASLSALTGAVLAARRPGEIPAMPLAGIFVLACGAGSLNQWQERRIDAEMERTKRRPLPAAAIRPILAFGFSMALIGFGLAILGTGGLTAVLLGAFAVVWYNGVYTYLKKKSAFAAVPGALTGAVPPAVGWVSAGGSISDAGLIMLGLFLFVWQVPHFWLVAVDKAGEYHDAGLRTPGDYLSSGQVGRIVSNWVLGTAACGLFFPLAGAIRAPLTRAAVLGFSLWLAFEAVRFRIRKGRTASALFIILNSFVLAILVLLCVDRLAG